MSIFCTLFGHTWVPTTLAPQRRWFTTKEGHTLVQGDLDEGTVRHLDRCVRCGTERDVGARRHDADNLEAPAQDA